jgi:sec-independent protein translocase protein TatA
MFGIGMPELLIILVIALLIFGAGKMPEVGSGLGKAIREFKYGMRQLDKEEETPAVEDTTVEKETPPQKTGDSQEGKKTAEEAILDQIPGVQEVKDLQAKASTIKKWSRLLFR